MFEQGDGPNIFSMPPGADFPALLVSGLLDWAKGKSPEALARVTVYVNTRRMARRIEALLDEGPAVLLPRLRLIGDLGRDTILPSVPPAASPLRRKFEIARLVAALIEADQDLAPISAVYDLADSLAALLDEMQGEGVAPDALERLDVADQSGHWARSLAFLRIVRTYLDPGGAVPDGEARRALAVAHLRELWKKHPPADPVIIAGSTGSRGTTAAFMELVARLPRGVVVLPGFDADTPGTVWAEIAGPGRVEDHPQARFARLLERLGIAPDAVRPWPGAVAPDPTRNRLVSLSLRPAPVTDRWLEEGPDLGPLGPATERLSLIEAPSPRIEAVAIALAIRDAVGSGRRVALVTPDRNLSRRVAATLDRWSIVADDSAGLPLYLTPPGRFLFQIARAMGGPMETAALLSLLKHPLAHSGSARGPHLRFTRELELHFREKGIPFPGGEHIYAWSAGHRDRGAVLWARWLGAWLEEAGATSGPKFTNWLKRAVSLAEMLARGPGEDGSGGLWEKEAGRKARVVTDAMARDGDAAGTMDLRLFRAVFEGVLSREEVREPVASRPDVMIWGTLEARVQGADLVILGGLNDGVWPQVPAPDPWLNRRLRAEAGMLLPDRRIGLSAHDYQQAIAAPEAILSRSMKSDDAQTVPSRWLNRLTNLMGGLPQSGGPEALKDMRARGDRWVAVATRIDRVGAGEDAPAPRPSPVPPVAARPRVLPVTAIQTLIRDPYAVYARRILGLKRLGPLSPEPDAALRGVAFHEMLKRFMRDPGDRSAARLVDLGETVLDEMVPWPLQRRLWRARLEDLAPWLVEQETIRGGFDSFEKAEWDGGIDLSEPTFRIKARADRIDILSSGETVIIDYKTGEVPGEKEIEHFDKQLLLEALIALEGGFPDIPPATVAEVVHVGLGSKKTYKAHKLEDTAKGRFSPETVRAGLEKRVRHFLDERFGFTARVAIKNVKFEGDYDHLSRYGEWDTDVAPSKERVG